MVQHRAARYTLNQYRRTDSVTAMLKTLSWPTLAQRRHHARLSMFYKIHHNLVAIDPSLILSSKQHDTPTRTENSLAYHILQSDTNYHEFSFYPRTVRDWNILPESAVKSETPAAFKEALKMLRLNCKPHTHCVRVFIFEVDAKLEEEEEMLSE